MAIIPFARVADPAPGESPDSVRDSVVGRLLDMCERARLEGDPERADRFLLAAWAAYDDPDGVDWAGLGETWDGADREAPGGPGQLRQA
jgi:hypothetical protein